MTTLLEIEAAVRQLSRDERQRLLRILAESLCEPGQTLPPPRKFTREEIQAWIDEDEADMKRFRGES
jgi:hypothetical protein